MKVKVTIDLADKRQASAFQELVSAQAEAAQKPISFSSKNWQAEKKYTNEEHQIEVQKHAAKTKEQKIDAFHALEDELYPVKPAEEKTEEKKKRAPRKTQATEIAPADDTAAENVEVTGEEVLTPAAEEVVHDEKPNNPVEYTEQEVRQLVADKVNANRPEIVKKLNELGSKSVTLLPKEKYGELVAFLNTLP